MSLIKINLNGILTHVNITDSQSRAKFIDELLNAADGTIFNLFQETNQIAVVKATPPANKTYPSAPPPPGTDSKWTTSSTTYPGQLVTDRVGDVLTVHKSGDSYRWEQSDMVVLAKMDASELRLKIDNTERVPEPTETTIPVTDEEILNQLRDDIQKELQRRHHRPNVVMGVTVVSHRNPPIVNQRLYSLPCDSQNLYRVISLVQPFQNEIEIDKALDNLHYFNFFIDPNTHSYACFITDVTHCDNGLAFGWFAFKRDTDIARA